MKTPDLLLWLMRLLSSGTQQLMLHIQSSHQPTFAYEIKLRLILFIDLCFGLYFSVCLKNNSVKIKSCFTHYFTSVILCSCLNFTHTSKSKIKIEALIWLIINYRSKLISQAKLKCVL